MLIQANDASKKQLQLLITRGYFVSDYWKCIAVEQ